MENAIERYWEKRLADVKAALEDNGFRALVAHDREAARRMVIEDILEKAGARSIAWGGSLTFIETGLYELLKDVGGMEVIDTYDKRIPREEVLERRRQALMADLFFTGTNALTAGGKLVNLDMIGNRVAALAFGPRQVVVLAGRNKIVPGLEEAMTRIRDYAAPVNTRRLQSAATVSRPRGSVMCGPSPRNPFLRGGLRWFSSTRTSGSRDIFAGDMQAGRP